MNKILPSFGVVLDDKLQSLQASLVGTLTGAFENKTGAFNNHPFLLDVNEVAAIGTTVSATNLLRRVLIVTLINRAPVEDVPTHILFVGVGDDYAITDEDDLRDITNAFESNGYVTPQFVFKKIDDADLEDTINTLIGKGQTVAELAPEVLTEPVKKTSKSK